MDKKKNSILVLDRGCCIMSKREGYFDGTYKEPDFTDNLGEGISSSDTILKREIKVINEQYYSALIRIKELNEEIVILKNKVEALENANLHNH